MHENAAAAQGNPLMRQAAPDGMNRTPTSSRMRVQRESVFVPHIKAFISSSWKLNVFISRSWKRHGRVTLDQTIQTCWSGSADAKWYRTRVR
jgi:hypothetical protein